MSKINACVIGASGYSGVELVRLLLNHPDVNIKSVCALDEAGLKFQDIFPVFKGKIDIKFSKVEDALNEKIDVVFFATPDGVAMKYASEFIKRNSAVIDISGDFRFKDISIYEKWYNRKHTAEDLLKESVYGLCELNREQIKHSKIIANPGCYPTAAILSITPILKQGLGDYFIIDAKTGISGAGRAATQTNLFSERNEYVIPYKIGYTHKHAPEIETHSSLNSGKQCRILFTPQTVPMTRGILETIYVKLTKKINLNEIFDIYKNFYHNNSFIHIRENSLPSTKDVYLTNNVHIGFALEERENILIIVTVIDNLIKGASGQAVQNMNIIFSFKEDTALL